MSNNGALSIDGERTSGQDIRAQNVTACVALANIVKSSLGPVGLDKMLVRRAPRAERPARPRPRPRPRAPRSRRARPPPHPTPPTPRTRSTPSAT
jgi:hypothetical protein